MPPVIAGLARSYGPALLLSAGSCTVLLWLDHSGTAPGVAAPLRDLSSAILLAALVPYCACVATGYQRLRHRIPWAEAWRVARSNLASGPALASLACGLLLTRMLLVDAVAWKYGIPTLTSFRFDPGLHRIELELLGGREAWQYFSTLLRAPWIDLVDDFYSLWYLAFAFVTVRAIWAAPSRRQARYCTALAVVWIGGSLAAVAIPSAGPIYYALVTGDPGPYAGLVSALHAQPLLATTFQSDLWRAYADGAVNLVAGIAAFPSLHVAMPALYLLSAPSRREAWFWSGFTALTWVCSTLLGWHYAIDGAAGVALSGLAWWLACRLHRETAATPNIPACSLSPKRQPAPATALRAICQRTQPPRKPLRMRIRSAVPLVAALLLASCGEQILHIESDTSWTGTIDGSPVSGRGSYEGRLPNRTAARGSVCWRIEKDSDAGTLRAWVEQGTFFGLGNVVESEMTTTAPHGVVSGCVE